MKFNYYYGNEAEQFSFIRIPKVMLTEERFAPLSLASKILYGVLLDRMALSVKNGWLDKEQRVYIIFKIEEIQELLGFSKKKSIEYLGELEAFGLVEKRRRGLGLPSILYIKSFMVKQEVQCSDLSVNSDEMRTSRGVEIDTSVSEEKQKKTAEPSPDNGTYTCDSMKLVKKAGLAKAEKLENKPFLGNAENEQEESCVRSVDLGTSGGAQNALQEVSFSEPQEVPVSTPPISNTKLINTKWSSTESNLIVSQDTKMGLDEMRAYKQLIKENIDYDSLLERYPFEKELVEGIFELILEMALKKDETTVIASGAYPTELVRSKFLELDYSHVEYVIGCLQSNTTKAKNIKKYLLAALFNAPSTISGYYTAEVNHDMPQFAMAK